ncbi:MULTISPECIES: chitin disaccharide deacetylase [Geobacillus thermoleovorans group]|uniref:Carbohydrate deacetylase n=1 Tax=Geobacillus stearothermophilus TaxID=1422 RepID=YDJC_GEOSE|nr:MULTISPECIES: chitin disaccharide deacetylase [Geobacillus thermoleovorans group]Q45401.1 RecName: Full=Carbohydrate deacetylase [Geobacillus stearothermophilus]AAA17391.1 putative phospho-beta-glucosidase [Geobacillus stearothermophilus]OQP14540.1 chitooligosaccharide deacetylase [Geobacillus thermoleovorans]QNU22141.1 chitin disaccharide deacetylase [Geobacillus thermoleovorans]TLS33809.1 chitin disaccharide deacetylase [Geobacillus thermoleovorans]WMJ21189.1 chitin disaccharide deacetyl
MPRYCIVNADDFGYSKGVNYGILEAFQNGVVTSATLMANMPAAEHAARLAKDHPELGVGIHFVLTCGRPLADVPSLVNENGEFPRRGEALVGARRGDIERELCAQLERFFSFGLTPTHIDSHHHVHEHPNVFPVVEQLAERYRLPIRPVRTARPHRLPTVDVFFPDFYGDGLTKDRFISLIDRIGDGQTAEVMCHPAYIDVPLASGSSYCQQRVEELAVLTDPTLVAEMAERGVQLITYREFYKL